MTRTSHSSGTHQPRRFVRLGRVCRHFPFHPRVSPLAETDGKQLAVGSAGFVSRGPASPPLLMPSRVNPASKSGQGRGPISASLSSMESRDCFSHRAQAHQKPPPWSRNVTAVTRTGLRWCVLSPEPRPTPGPCRLRVWLTPCSTTDSPSRAAVRQHGGPPLWAARRRGRRRRRRADDLLQPPDLLAEGRLGDEQRLRGRA